MLLRSRANKEVAGTMARIGDGRMIVRRLLASAIVAIACVPSLAQPPAAPKVFTEPTIGFRYEPPSGFFNLTEYMRRGMEKQAQQQGKKRTLNLLLALQSGPNDTASDWQAVTIESYERAQVAGKTDRDACLQFAKMSAGNRVPIEEAKDTEIGGMHFVVAEFEMHEGTLTKRAIIYVMNRAGQVVSFSFSGNDAAAVRRSAESMKTIKSL